MHIQISTNTFRTNHIYLQVHIFKPLPRASNAIVFPPQTSSNQLKVLLIATTNQNMLMCSQVCNRYRHTVMPSLLYEEDAVGGLLFCMVCLQRRAHHLDLDNIFINKHWAIGLI